MKLFSKKTKTVAEMTDEECLASFLSYLEDRVTVGSGFIRDLETGNITHQVIQVQCGEFVSVSEPQELDVILRVATAEEQGAALN